MKTTSLKLQRIAAVVAIIAAPMPVLAVDGPLPISTWIPGAEIIETVAPLSTSLQPGPYNARDVYKVFVTAVAGKDLQLVVTGSPAGVKVDYFDERRTNGLYAIFGAVDAGTITLSFQTAPTGTTTWTTVETKVLKVGAPRTLIYDTADVPINVWYTVYDSSGWASSGTTLASRLDIDFPLIKAQGFTSIFFSNPEVNAGNLGTIFSKATQYGLKVQISTFGTYALIKNNRYMAAHNNVPILLSMENTLVAAGLNTDVGGGVLMKNHPQLWSYVVYDEPYGGLQNPLELALMMTKSIDRNHSGQFAIGGYVGPSWGPTIVGKTMFSDFIGAEVYPFTAAPNLTPTSDFSHQFGPGAVPLWPSIPVLLSNYRAYDPRRYVESIAQAWSGGAFRAPSPKELRATQFIGAARGVRPFTYFSFRTFGGVKCMVTGSSNFPEPANPGLWAEAALINAKLKSWMPTYKNLAVSSTGSTPITYALNGAVVGNFVHVGTGNRYLIVVNTDTVNTKTVTVNGILNKAGGTATKARDVVTGTKYNLTSGTLSLSLPPGDAALLRLI